jgi:TonB family protein
MNQLTFSNKDKRILVRLIAPIFAICLMTSPCLSQGFSSTPHAYMPESYIRETAVKTAIPTYPEEALRQGVSGVVRIRIEISGEGDILRIRIKPRTNPMLKEAVVDAAKQWKFKPHYRSDGSVMPMFSRLTFVFVINDGKSSVELYNPPPDAPQSEYIGYSNTAREFREWREWEEVWTSKDIPHQE